MAVNGHKILTVVVFSLLGAYSGTKFFEPIIVEQLRKDGHLRTDIEIPEFDKNGDKIVNGVNKSEKLDELKDKLTSKKD
ncbi:Ecm19 protein [Martiniozyma asiatica (nom. inval.)]|nr:Ecm19 protein [Martiniozyma asiatica]